MTIIVAVALCATSAFASKARLRALSASPHLQDTRDVFAEPDQALVHGEFVSIETSANDATTGNDTAPNAQGGFVRKLNDNSAMGAWLGNKTNLVQDSFTTVGATQTIQNPLNLYYAAKAGDMQWGAGFNYSSFEDKGITKTKSSSMGLNVSASSTAGWEANLGLGLSGESNDGTTKEEPKSPVSLFGGYWMDTMFLYGKYAMGGAKSKNVATGASAGERDLSDIEVGIINSHKKDGADFFYGIAYSMTTDKTKGGSKDETTALPVTIGIEADAASWLVLRGSIKQNVLMGTTKTTPATGASTEVNMKDNTVVATGLGLKLGKFMVDGSLAASTSASGKFGSDTGFLSEVGLTYAF